MDFFRARFARFFSVQEGGEEFFNAQRSGLKFFKNSGEPVTSKPKKKGIETSPLWMVGAGEMFMIKT